MRRQRTTAAVESPHKQRGVTLLMSVVFLATLALLGASAGMNTTLQERMASNTRDRDLAFQAAEAALQDAENTLTTWCTLAFDGSVAGLITYDPSLSDDAVYWGAIANWASYKNPTHSLNQVGEQPRYRVAKMTTVGLTKHYRVTARGVGGDSNAVVVLQALFASPSILCP